VPDDSVPVISTEHEQLEFTARARNTGLVPNVALVRSSIWFESDTLAHSENRFLEAGEPPPLSEEHAIRFKDIRARIMYFILTSLHLSDEQSWTLIKCIITERNWCKNL
jgi:hypothetical protein